MRTVQELADLTGRGALVVGGAGYLGRAACAALDELGAEVLAADLQADAGSGKTPTLAVDLRDEDATRGLIPRVIDRLGRLDVLVHCAAYTGATQAAGWAAPFEQQTIGAWDDAQRVSVTSAFVLAQEARQALAESGHGSVVLLSSIYGVVGPDFRLYESTDMHSPAGYAASKGGLLQLTRYLATLLAPEVRVNAVSPGGVLRGQDKRFVARYEHGTPLGRMAAEEDLKGAVAYLASDLSAYVTGTNLMVDGGRTAW